MQPHGGTAPNYSYAAFVLALLLLPVLLITLPVRWSRKIDMRQMRL